MTPTSKAADAPTGEIDGANLGQVREILFGNHIRDVDQRFAKLDARLAKEVAELKSDVQKRLESMDMFVKAELQSLADAIKDEQSERSQSLKEASRELDKATTGLEKKLTRLEDRHAKSERKLNQHILDQVTSLRDDLSERAAALEALVEREATTLNDAKTDRTALAALLQEVALRLTDGIDLSEIG